MWYVKVWQANLTWPWLECGAQVMGAGAIPVIIVDHYTLPYKELLDWDNFSIRVPEHRMLEVRQPHAGEISTALTTACLYSFRV